MHIRRTKHINHYRWNTRAQLVNAKYINKILIFKIVNIFKVSTIVGIQWTGWAQCLNYPSCQYHLSVSQVHHIILSAHHEERKNVGIYMQITTKMRVGLELFFFQTPLESIWYSSELVFSIITEYPSAHENGQFRFLFLYIFKYLPADYVYRLDR